MPERLADDCELKALAIEDPIERYILVGFICIIQKIKIFI